MKHFLLPILLIVGVTVGVTGCAKKSPNSDQPASTATTQAAIGQLIQKTVGKSVAYKPLKWAEVTPLRAEDMGELAVQQQLALWTVDKQRAGGFYDTIYQAQDLIRKGYSQVALMKAAAVADAVEHRAEKRALIISRMLDSVRRPHPKPLTVAVGSRVLHTFQLTDKKRKVTRDSAAFIILPSGTVLFSYPLTQRFWEPDRSDPF